MVELTREQLDAFLSKTDFDFSSPAGWKEFLAERSQGGAGRDADGIQLRDIRNYAVGSAFVSSTGQPVRVQFNIRTYGTGLALPPGMLYVYHPDAGWNYTVTSRYIGPPGSSIDLYLDVAGGGTPTRPDWGSICYIVLKSGDLPGQGAAETLGKRALNQALRGSGWLARGGFRMLSMGEAGYSVSVRVGGSEWVRDYFMPQEILSEEGQAAIAGTAKDIWEGLGGSE